MTGGHVPSFVLLHRVGARWRAYDDEGPGVRLGRVAPRSGIGRRRSSEQRRGGTPRCSRFAHTLLEARLGDGF